MHPKYLALATLLPIFLTGCGSSGGGGRNLQPDQPAIESSLSSVPAEYRDAVKAAKTFNPLAVQAEDLMDDQGMVLKQVVVNGEALKSDNQYDFSKLKNGLNNLAINVTYGLPSDNQSQETAKGNLFIYQQPYSVVTGSVMTQDSGPLTDPADLGTHFVDDIKGLKTASSAIDTLSSDNAVFTYEGTAFNGQDQGTLSYSVDFGAREGSGTITGLTQTGTIDLQTASIANVNTEMVKGMGIAGKAQFANDPGKDIDYALGFFGPKAEEIAGRISYANDADNDKGFSEIGFGGTKR